MISAWVICNSEKTAQMTSHEPGGDSKSRMSILWNVASGTWVVAMSTITGETSRPVTLMPALASVRATGTPVPQPMSRTREPEGWVAANHARVPCSAGWCDQARWYSSPSVSNTSAAFIPRPSFRPNPPE